MEPTKKRKRDPPTPPHESTQPSDARQYTPSKLLSASFQHLKQLFWSPSKSANEALLGTNLTVRNTTAEAGDAEEDQTMHSPKSKRSKKPEPNFITSSPKPSPKVSVNNKRTPQPPRSSSARRSLSFDGGNNNTNGTNAASDATPAEGDNDQENTPPAHTRSNSRPPLSRHATEPIQRPPTESTEPPAPTSASWTDTLFSPMLRFLGRKPTGDVSSSEETNTTTGGGVSRQSSVTNTAVHAGLTRQELHSDETLDFSRGPLADRDDIPVAVVIPDSDAGSRAYLEGSDQDGGESTVDFDIDDRILELHSTAAEVEDVNKAIHDDEEEDIDEAEEGDVEQRQQHNDDDDEEEEFDSYMFIATLPPRNILPPLPDAPALPKKSKRSHKVTLVLDLDETLVHCTLHPTERHDVTFAVPFQGEDFKVYVRKRPHFDKFVEEVGRKFEVVIFTASQQVYADRLLDILDPERTWSKHRLFRDSCLPVLGNYLKDLNILGRDLSKAVIVDNSPHVFGYQLDNGIPIESWFDDDNDTELLKLLPFLDTLIPATDVRPLVRSHFQLFKRVQASYNAFFDKNVS